ncbi:MAG: methylmalonyl-CoA epimerase [Chloroflexi bacterium]|nr:methylmalonyl-CoA epimerase [Chloroflexota bacterium]
MTSPCVARHINHVAIAVRDIQTSLSMYQGLFGAGDAAEIEEIADQKVKACLVRIGGSQIEFIQPTDLDSGVAKFIEKRGESVHHICFEVDKLSERLKALKASGVQLIDEKPRHGLSGQIAFIHPKSTGGVLIELVDQDTAKR